MIRARGLFMKKILTLFLTFFKIGAFTFGGGYAMLALLENELVDKKKWLTRDEFLDMTAVAESTPGPVAVFVRPPPVSDSGKEEQRNTDRAAYENEENGRKIDCKK